MDELDVRLEIFSTLPKEMDLTENQLNAFLDECYHLQRGEYWPEIHKDNLENLASRYPDIPRVIQDQLYRFAISLDLAANQYVEKSKSGESNLDTAIDELGVTYRYFSRSVIEFALDWAGATT